MISSRVFRVKAFVLLFLMTFEIIVPTTTWALTGQNQPELSSYEPTHNTDNVDLMTGDMTYTIPLMSVPSPEGGVSFPLAYHSGIAPDEESSWVGLGWNINLGSIVRDVKEYPDDFNGQSISSEMFDAGGHGYSLNIPKVGSISYDSEKGYGGVIGLAGLEIGFGTQLGLSVFGLNSDDTPAQMAKKKAIGLALAIVNLGVSAAIGEKASSVLGLATSMYSVSASINSSMSNVNNWSVKRRNFLFYSDYSYHLDYTRTDKAYGSLYLGQAYDRATVAMHVASQIHPPSIVTNLKNGDTGTEIPLYKFYSSSNNNVNETDVTDCSISMTGERAYSIEPVHTAYDNYRIMGGSVSGTVQPYRHEIGTHSVALNGSTDGQDSFILSKFLKYDDASTTDIKEKVPFYYLGDNSNYYLSHMRLPLSPIDSPSQYGVQLNNSGSGSGNRMSYTIQDSRIFFDTNTQTASDSPHALQYQLGDLDREGASIENVALGRSKHVAWFTLEELGFVTLADSRRDLIGGFEVTDEKGTIYHYKQPVLNTAHLQYSAGNDNDYSKSEIAADYPTSWLLTSVAGVDYVDRAPLGEYGPEDWGYWVEYNYGRFSTNYGYRSPYSGNTVDEMVYQNPVLPYNLIAEFK